MSTSTLAMKVFTFPLTLGLILEYLDYNLSGHRCMAKTHSGKRCSRKNCQITLLCSQHADMWREKIDISLFYHRDKWERRCERWIEEERQCERSHEHDMLALEY